MMTSPVASAAWMMLPRSTWRRPARRNRRNDLGIAERRLGVIDRGLIGLDERFLLRNDGALGIGLLLRSGIGGGQLLVALQIKAHIGKLRFILGLLRTV